MTGMQALWLAFIFVFGCMVGSFLNVCIWRLPRGMGINAPRRSFCPLCEAPIEWYDNIPLVSFAALGRRCRACGGAISWRYPAIEGLTGLLFALLYYRQSVRVGADAGQVAVMMLATGLLIVGSAVDMEWLIIPDEISLYGILGGLTAGLLIPRLHVGDRSYHTFSHPAIGAHLGGLSASLLGAIVGGGIVLACAGVGFLIFRREAMGIGDAKVLGMIGAFFGWKVAVLTFFLAPFMGLLYGLPLLVTRDEHVMPYGPFLGIGAVLAILFRTPLCARLVPLERLFGMLVG